MRGSACIVRWSYSRGCAARTAFGWVGAGGHEVPASDDGPGKAEFLDININMMLMFEMRTITMVELRTDSERIVRELKRGERLMLSYRGEPLAELVPSANSGPKRSPLEALALVQKLTSEDHGYGKKAAAYLSQLGEDRKTWGQRSPS